MGAERPATCAAASREELAPLAAASRAAGRSHNADRPMHQRAPHAAQPPCAQGCPVQGQVPVSGAAAVCRHLACGARGALASHSPFTACPDEDEAASRAPRTRGWAECISVVSRRRGRPRRGGSALIGLLVLGYVVAASAQHSPCVGLEASSHLINQGHECLGCEWVHVAGAESVPRVNGLYRRVNESSAERLSASCEAKFSWLYGGEDLRLQWTSSGGGAWVIRSNSLPSSDCNATLAPELTCRDPASFVPDGSTVYCSTLYRANHSASNPVLVASGAWERVSTTQDGQNFAENTLRVQCVANPDEFTIRTAARELVSFGFNFYGELGRSENVLSLNPVSTPGLVQNFGGVAEAEYVEQLSTGCNHGLARTRAGRVWSWGTNAKGQLGVDKSAGMAKANLPQVVPMERLGGEGKVDLVVAGGSFSIVRVRLGDGRSSLFTAGSNRYGQLGRNNANLGIETFNSAFDKVALSPETHAIGAGRHHAIALVKDASGVSLYSWGNNRYGQLGRTDNEGTDNPNYEPEPIVEKFLGKNGVSQTPVAIALGRFHSVVMTSEGTLFCFGSNLRGQCGPMLPDYTFQPGSDAPNSEPRLLDPSLIGHSAVVAISAGEYSTMLKTADGKIWGFGRNFYGQLTASAGGLNIGTPISNPHNVDISALHNASGISRFAVGGDHSVMIYGNAEDSGTPELIAVGSNVYGQLGTATGVGQAVSHPLLAPSIESLGCGATFGVGGANRTGVGDCATGYMRAIDVSASCDQTVIMTERPVCPAGTNSSAEGVQPCSICPAGSFQPLSGASTCHACAQGLFSFAGSTACLTCANGTNTTADRGAECLRICRPGEYGVQQEVGEQGLMPCSLCPVDHYSDEVAATSCKACPPFSGSTVQGLVAKNQCRRYCDEGTYSVDGLQVDGACSSCPAGKHQPNNRTTFCIGCPVGKFSEAGSSTCTDCPRGSFSDAANTSSCSLCDFGSYQERLGQTSCEPCRGDKSTTFLGATNESDCSVTVFQVWGVGNNLWGQLGSGWVLNSTLPINSQPVQVANDVGNSGRGLNNEQVLLVSAGFSHTLFLTTEGHLWAAGQNVYGQLGREPRHLYACSYADAPDLACLDDPKPNAIPSLINSSYFHGRKLLKASAGRHVSVVLTTDGRVYTWGYNRYGQLGRSENAGSDEANWVPTEVAPALWDGRPIADVAVGSYHVLVLANDGTVFAFGLNRYGQLGSKANVGQWAPNWRPLHINPSNLSNSLVTGMAAGATHSLLLTEHEEVWAFGSNGWGQLGSEQQAFVWGAAVYTPIRVMTGVVEIAAGGKHSLLRTRGGELFGTGSNYYGQLASRTAVGDRTAIPVRLEPDVFDSLHFAECGPGQSAATSTACKALSAGGDNTIVQSVQGSERVLWLFGSNRYGQLAVAEGAGGWDFHPDPYMLATCQLMDPQYCDRYTMMDFSVGGGFVMIQTGAKVCPPGTTGNQYGRPGTAGGCQECPAGKYSEREGSTECGNCGAGRYSSAGSSACSRCERGKYSGAEVASFCFACPEGKTMEASTNRTSIDECLKICRPGEAASQNSTVDGVGAGACQVCAAGKYNREKGATACTDCARGTYSAANSSVCTDCPVDHTTYPSGGESVGDCLLLCQPGSYSGTGGGGACTPCGVGKFSAEPGATACISCPMGFSTAAPGASSCQGFCEKGTVSANGLQPCSACLAGKYAGLTAQVACDDCPAGSYSASVASACTQCNPGYKAATPGSPECSPCGAGSVQPLQGSAFCTKCPPGFFAASDNATVCDACPPGFTTEGAGASACSSCAAGMLTHPLPPPPPPARHPAPPSLYLPPPAAHGRKVTRVVCGVCLRETAGKTLQALGGSNVSTCRECAPGSYAAAGAEGCSLCARGYYSAVAGASNCTRCASGTTFRVLSSPREPAEEGGREGGGREEGGRKGREEGGWCSCVQCRNLALWSQHGRLGLALRTLLLAHYSSPLTVCRREPTAARSAWGCPAPSRHLRSPMPTPSPLWRSSLCRTCRWRWTRACGLGCRASS